jgi:hypothetical protein
VKYVQAERWAPGAIAEGDCCLAGNIAMDCIRVREWTVARGGVGSSLTTAAAVAAQERTIHRTEAQMGGACFAASIDHVEERERPNQSLSPLVNLLLPSFFSPLSQSESGLLRPTPFSVCAGRNPPRQKRDPDSKPVLRQSPQLCDSEKCLAWWVETWFGWVVGGGDSGGWMEQRASEGRREDGSGRDFFCWGALEWKKGKREPGLRINIYPHGNRVSSGLVIS